MQGGSLLAGVHESLLDLLRACVAGSALLQLLLVGKVADVFDDLLVGEHRRLDLVLVRVEADHVLILNLDRMRLVLLRR